MGFRGRQWLAMFLTHEHLEQQQADADRYSGISDVEDRPEPEIDKVVNVAKAEAVDDIAHRAAKNERKRDVNLRCGAFAPVPQIKSDEHS